MLDKLSSYIMLSWGIRRFLITFFAGALLNLAMPPFDFPAGLFISFPVLVWLIDSASGNPDKGFITRRIPAFTTGWIFGFGYFSTGLWWLVNALFNISHTAYWMIPLALFALPGCLAIFYGFAVVFARLLWSDGLGRIFALAASFGLFEYLRAIMFTGFPWNVIGYGAMPIPIAMQSAEIVGIFGMSVVVVFTASVPALFATKGGLRLGLLMALLFISLHLGYGAWSLSHDSNETTSTIVRIVQPSVSQSEKWDQQKQKEIFQTYLALSSAPPDRDMERPSIIIWPETAVPYILTQSPEALAQIADTLKIGQTLITGAVRLKKGYNGQPDQYFNTVYVINDEGRIIDSADKHHLVPFGEYLPFEDYARSIGLAPLVETFGGFSAAIGQKLLTLPNGFRFLPLICYEAIFPKYAAYKTNQINAIINLSNDTWYGITPGPYQHLRQAQLRSVENRLPLIRSTNNGISVITDSYGQIKHGLALNYVGFIDAPIASKRALFWHSNARHLTFLALICIFIIISAVFKAKIKDLK